MKETLVLIDGNSLIHRAFHALPPLTSPTGESVGAVYGFASMLLNVIETLKPQYIAVAWDVSAPTRRIEKYEQYKAHRPETDDDLKSQFPLVKELVESFNFPQFGVEGFEADDVIGTLSQQAMAHDIEVIIVTGDTDALQLVRDGMIKVFLPRKSLSDTVLYDEGAVQEKYEGLGPTQLVDYRALKGDASDNIPGVAGIGEKTAIMLLNQYKTLDSIYAQIDAIEPKHQKKLLADKEMAYVSQDLATIQTDAPILLDLPATTVTDYDSQKAMESLQKFGFRSLLSRLPQVKETVVQIEAKELPQLDGKAKSEEEFDVLIAGYLLTGRSGNSLTLANLAFDYLGVPLSDEVSEEEIQTVKHHLQEYFIKEFEKPENAALRKLFYEVEMPLREVLKQMHDHGILVDLPALLTMRDEFAETLQGLEKQIYQEIGHEINLNSPKQLQEVLFDELQLPVLKKTKTQRSTDESVLQKLKDMHPIVRLLLEYRKIHKLKSTYLDPFPDFLDETNRMHTTFNQVNAASGRLSSEDPNLQNIPIGEDVHLRRLFIAPPGRKLLKADYSQIELRIMAHITGDKGLIAAFSGAQDIHSATASRLFEKPIELIGFNERKIGKTTNFALMYGMSPHGLAESLSIPQGEAKQYIDRFFAGYPQVKEWQEKYLAEARERGYVETLYGRRRVLPDLRAKQFFLRSAAERVAINHPLQGTQADFIKMAMVHIQETIEKDGIDMQMLLQVHDELVFEVADDHVRLAATLVKKLMIDVITLDVPVEVDVAVGQNWEETVKLEV